MIISFTMVDPSIVSLTYDKLDRSFKDPALSSPTLIFLIQFISVVSAPIATRVKLTSMPVSKNWTFGKDGELNLEAK